MTDQVKFQDSTAPAAVTDKDKKISLKKPAKGSQIIINPPEKADPRRTNESFKQALEKHTVMIEGKTKIVLQAKANILGISEDVIRQVFVRGYEPPLPIPNRTVKRCSAIS